MELKNVMTREEIEERIQQLEDRLFYIDMKDYWSSDDYVNYDKIRDDIKELTNILKDMD